MATIQTLPGVLGTKKIYNVDPRCISVKDKWNPRIDFSDIEDLARQIVAARGVYQPLAVRKSDDDRIILADGERRLRASLIVLKWLENPSTAPADVDLTDFTFTHVPAVFLRPGATDQEALLMTVIATQGAKPWMPVEEARALQRLRQGEGGAAPMSVLAIAKAVGRSDVWVADRLLLVTTADPEVQKALQNHKVGVTLATQIARSGGPEKQKTLIRKAIASKAAKKEVQAQLAPTETVAVTNWKGNLKPALRNIIAQHLSELVQVQGDPTLNAMPKDDKELVEFIGTIPQMRAAYLRGIIQGVLLVAGRPEVDPALAAKITQNANSAPTEGVNPLPLHTAESYTTPDFQ